MAETETETSIVIYDTPSLCTTTQKGKAFASTVFVAQEK
jgi:hypothetical protein